MGTFVIEGGHELSGELTPQGAKNEALQILCAVLLSSEKITIHNIPNIRDVNKLIDLLKVLGVKVEKVNHNSYEFQANDIAIDLLKSPEYAQLGKGLRGSVMILGPLLSRFGKAFIPTPGGDKIGRRRLDTHFQGFIKLGANFNYDPKNQFYYVDASKLSGKFILMDEISVTGTANIITAAVLAKGVTTIYNAACEPYVQQLCKMLVKMGAKISGIGSNLLSIEGVENLSGCEHHILPDIIEIGSFIGLAALTGSELTIKNVSWNNLGQIPDVFKKLGIRIKKSGKDDLLIPKQNEYVINKFIDGSILNIYDSPWPGFTPDLISIILVVASQAKGSVLVHQKMFESRLFFVDKLIDMGAQIILCDPHRATVIGLNRQHSLRGIEMTSPDIRAGVALLIAALSAEGESIIHNIEQIDRGYEKIDQRLNNIGAQITRVV